MKVISKELDVQNTASTSILMPGRTKVSIEYDSKKQLNFQHINIYEY
jgi:hypothetical protein